MAQKVLDQIRQLEEQKQALLNEARDALVKAAQSAIDELNELGFTYQLVEGNRTRSTPSSSSRRPGVRDEVHQAVKMAGTTGITAAAVRKALGIDGGTNSPGYSSVANALAALKKAKKIAQKGDSYVAA